MRNRISVVLIDDNPSRRHGVVALLRAQPGFRVLAACVELEKALQKVRAARPAMVLLSLRREGEDRLMLAGALHRNSPESRVLVLGLEPLHEDVASLVRAGASGFVMANASFDRFLGTLYAVAQGMQVLPGELTHALFDQLKGRGVRRRPRERVSATRRVEVATFSRNGAGV